MAPIMKICLTHYRQFNGRICPECCPAKKHPEIAIGRPTPFKELTPLQQERLRDYYGEEINEDQKYVGLLPGPDGHDREGEVLTRQTNRAAYVRAGLVGRREVSEIEESPREVEAGDYSDSPNPETVIPPGALPDVLAAGFSSPGVEASNERGPGELGEGSGEESLESEGV